MNVRLQASVAVALVGLSACAVTHQAQACGLDLVRSANGNWTITPPVKPSTTTARQMFLAKAARNLVAASRATTKAIRNSLQFLAPIAGLYKVTMTAEGNVTSGLPNRASVDHADVQWHAAGTEIMNSGRPAGDGDFCLGTRAQTGPRTYQLKHFMLSWVQGVAANGVDIDDTFVGPAGIQETVTLGRNGSSYSGAFVLTQYDTNYNIILPGDIPIKSTVNGTRKTISLPVTY